MILVFLVTILSTGLKPLHRDGLWVFWFKPYKPHLVVLQCRTIAPGNLCRGTSTTPFFKCFTSLSSIIELHCWKDSLTKYEKYHENPWNHLTKPQQNQPKKHTQNPSTSMGSNIRIFAPPKLLTLNGTECRNLTCISGDTSDCSQAMGRGRNRNAATGVK